MKRYLQFFVLGGIVASIAIYILDNLDGRLSGLLLSLPFTIPLLWFVNCPQKLQDYSTTILSMSLLILLANLVFVYSWTSNSVRKNYAVCLSIATWFVGCLLYYCYV